MKSKKLMMTSFLLAGMALPLVGCGGGNVITLWVGSESADFYQATCDDYIANNPDFKYRVKVVGTDTGTTGGAMVTDNKACGDIVTVAHDNIGKLVEKSLALPIYGTDLIQQVRDDNPASFLNVVYSTYNGETNLYGVPYISQALFLYYNKAYVSAEQAKTFEGLTAAAKAKGSSTKAFTITGTDGFNYSFNLLAVKASDKSTTLKLYQNLQKTNCYAQGDDEVASLRWAQRVFNDGNGGLLPTDSGWATDLKNGKSLGVIGGAWHYNAASAALGVSNLGITVIPTYALTSSDVSGTSIAEGTVMQGGTFADCKCFLINAAAKSSKYEGMQTIIKYLSSKAVQLKSFVSCANVPAYSGSETDIAGIKDQVDATVYDLAVAQTTMAGYGIPQPFVTGTLNTYFYSMKAPDYYKNAVINADSAYATTDSLRVVLYTMEYIWQKGKAPAATDIPSVLPSDVI